MTDDRDVFDVDSLFDENARDWPYSGARNIVTSGVIVQAHEKFGTVYDDADKAVPFEDRNSYDKDDLPVGFTFYPQVNLVLNMIVEDVALPEPTYPPVIGLGTTRGVTFSDDGTTFQFVSPNGSVRNPSANSNFSAFVKALSALDPAIVAQFKATPIVDGDKVWHTAAFDNLPLVYDSAEVPVPGRRDETKVKAWPVAYGTVDADADTGASVGDQITAAAKANADDPEAFRNAVMNIKGAPASVITSVAKNPEAALAEALA